jgi:16S rRNA (adenine1518-N6/adenine1519-N6)-dimethyltransferase
MNKTQAVEILKSISLAPNKRLGQNFLVLDQFSEKIVSSAGISASNRVVEIGPGLGSLTEIIAKIGCSLVCVEIDAGYAAYLGSHFSEQSNVSVLHEDFLRMNEYPRSDIVISNLPYYCASEILFTIAQKISPLKICAMMQKEMSQRITASAGSEHYGAMTVTLSYYYVSSVLFNVPPDAFYPRPDVISTVILFTRIDRADLSAEEVELFHLVVKSAFWGRRKTIVKSLSSSPHISIDRILIEEALDAAGISREARGETLSLNSYIILTKNLFSRISCDDRTV